MFVLSFFLRLLLSFSAISNNFTWFSIFASIDFKDSAIVFSLQKYN